MKKTALILLIYFAVYLLIIIVNWIGIYLPQSRTGVADGASGLGRNIASLFLGVCSFITLVSGVWSFYLFKNPQFISAVQIVILVVLAVFSVGLLLYIFG